MLLYNTQKGALVLSDGKYYAVEGTWDDIINQENIHDYLAAATDKDAMNISEEELNNALLTPIMSQEVWASGVTYFRSKTARMEESKDAGGGDFYDRVYDAPRPELFFKSPSYRVVGPNDKVRIRRDSNWNVPEPELTLAISSEGKIIGYTVGNDMSSRDIEGENPLYLPQAKSYDGAAAIGPCIWVTKETLSPETVILLEIFRNDEKVFTGTTEISQIKRSFEELVEYLFRETTFKYGCYLMTGTGIVPPDSFTLQSGDDIKITIDNIGTLINTVA